MNAVFYNPNRLEGFLLLHPDFPAQKILDIDRNPDRFDLVTRHQQRRYAFAIFRVAFVKPKQATPTFRRFKRLIFSLSRRLFTLLFPTYSYSCAMQILQDHLATPVEKKTKGTQAKKRGPPSAEWEKELIAGAKKLQEDWGFSHEETWSRVVENYPAHAPFTDETALQLCENYRGQLEKNDQEEKERVEKAIKRFQT